MKVISHTFGLLLLAATSFSGTSVAAQTGNVPSPSGLLLAPDTGAASKGGRLLAPDGLDDQSGAYGLEFFDRIGGDLPDLPPEKPYNGPVDIAYGAYQRGHFEQAYEAALKQSQKGDPAAETLIAEMIGKKQISRQRAGDPIDWYRMAADSNDPGAVNRYGMALVTSKNKDDVAKGRALIKKAAEGGNPAAEFNYGNLLIQAQPGQEGLDKALPWFEKAAAAAVPDAEYALSQIYPTLK